MIMNGGGLPSVMKTFVGRQVVDFDSESAYKRQQSRVMPESQICCPVAVLRKRCVCLFDEILYQRSGYLSVKIPGFG